MIAKVFMIGPVISSSRENCLLSDSGTKTVKEFDQEEYYIQRHYGSVLDALKLFTEDDLLSKPGIYSVGYTTPLYYMASTCSGTEYNYTTHGWTLISAVLEKVSNQKFLQYMSNNVFKPLGMSSTSGEFHEPLVYNRARYKVQSTKYKVQQHHINSHNVMFHLLLT